MYIMNKDCTSDQPEYPGQVFDAKKQFNYIFHRGFPG